MEKGAVKIMDIYIKHEEAVKAFEQGNEEFLNRWVILSARMNKH